MWLYATMQVKHLKKKKIRQSANLRTGTNKMPHAHTGTQIQHQHGQVDDGTQTHIDRFSGTIRR